MMERRTLLRGIGALLCAPAIVRATSLMPIRIFEAPSLSLLPGAANATDPRWPGMTDSFVRQFNHNFRFYLTQQDPEHFPA